MTGVRVKGKVSCQKHINVMPGHGANPIFLNKKIKVRRPEHLLRRYKMSGNPVKSHRNKNHGKKPRRNSPCNKVRKHRYITRRKVFLLGFNQRAQYRTIAGIC